MACASLHTIQVTKALPLCLVSNITLVLVYLFYLSSHFPTRHHKLISQISISFPFQWNGIEVQFYCFSGCPSASKMFLFFCRCLNVIHGRLGYTSKALCSTSINCDSSFLFILWFKIKLFDTNTVSFFYLSISMASNRKLALLTFFDKSFFPLGNWFFVVARGLFRLPRAFLPDWDSVRFTLAVLPTRGVLGWDLSTKTFAVEGESPVTQCNLDLIFQHFFY